MDPIGPPQARATGKLKQLKSANSIVQAGELLASLQLEEGIRVSIGYENRLGLVDMEGNDVTFEFCVSDKLWQRVFLLTYIYISIWLYYHSILLYIIHTFLIIGVYTYTHVCGITWHLLYFGSWICVLLMWVDWINQPIPLEASIIGPTQLGLKMAQWNLEKLNYHSLELTYPFPKACLIMIFLFSFGGIC